MSTSRNLRERLSPKPVNYEPIQPPYVANVRVQVDKLKNSGSQQHRLRYGDECWLVSQDRWLKECRAAGETWEKIIGVLQSCVDEASAIRDNEEALAEVTAEAFVEDARRECAAGFYEDTATIEALHFKSAGHFRSVAERARSQAEALQRKARKATALALRLASTG